MNLNQTHHNILCQIAQKSLPLWGFLPNTPLQLINVSENATFKISLPNQHRILRLYRPDYHQASEILSELAWINALQENNIIETASVIAGCNGQELQMIEADGQSYHMVMFDYLAGSHIDAEQAPDYFHHLGKISAILHAHSKQWQMPDFFSRLTWDYEGMIGDKPHWASWKNASNLTADALEILCKAQAKIARNLQSYGMNQQNFGLIHADLRLANLLFETDSIKIIDFDDCGFSWFLYDLAASFSFIEDHPQKQNMVEAWLDAYQQHSHNALGKQDIAMIDSFIMLRRMILMGWLSTHDTSEFSAEMKQNFTAHSCLLAEEFLY